MEAGRQVRRLLHSSRLEMLVAWTKGGRGGGDEQQSDVGCISKTELRRLADWCGKNKQNQDDLGFWPQQQCDTGADGKRGTGNKTGLGYNSRLPFWAR